MDPSPLDLRSLGQTIERSSAFDVAVADGWVEAVRRRRLGNRGLLLLLFPRVVARVAVDGGRVRVSLRPDVWAIVSLVIFSGAVVTELTMDRAVYPRDYPPAAPFALGAFVVVTTLLEAVRTRQGVLRSLGRAD